MAMAKPEYHIGPTVLCMALGYWAGGGWQEAAAASFTGLFLDGDHLSPLRVITALKGKMDKDYRGWIDYFHTWYGAVVLLGLCAVLGWWWFAMLSYVLHMLIDAGNRENLVSGEAPLPGFLFRFYPPWLTYQSGL
jgi:hypothetical protein